ncbi:MAG: hypothetical protein F4W89_13915 [Acidobacteria bacterium]|nr:hypothetical protein [Acidobacteriota bacterium]
MSRTFATLCTLALLVALAPLPSLAQDAERTMPMRTPDGKPDVSGIFTFRTLTPLQRPEQFEGQETLSLEDAAAFEAAERTRRNRDLFDPEKGALFYRPRSEGGVLSYNEFWYERGVEMTSDKRTSLIIDPPDGRLPPRVPRTEEEIARSREEAAQRAASRYDSYENRSMADRCLMGFNSGPPMRSSTYNNNVMVFQSPGWVAILTEMVHDARLIPVDDTPMPPFPQRSGVSRARYEGESLIIETTQFAGGSSGLTSTNMHLVERLTRIDADTVAYEYTVTDPTVYTAPYTVMMPFRRLDGTLFEYACHEGNYGLYNILAGARQFERDGRELRP